MIHNFYIEVAQSFLNHYVESFLPVGRCIACAQRDVSQHSIKNEDVRVKCASHVMAKMNA